VRSQGEIEREGGLVQAMGALNLGGGFICRCFRPARTATVLKFRELGHSGYHCVQQLFEGILDNIHIVQITLRENVLACKSRKVIKAVLGAKTFCGGSSCPIGCCMQQPDQKARACRDGRCDPSKMVYLS